MYHITTGPMTREQRIAFLCWFDKHIGTDREVNEEAPNAFFVDCFDLMESEAKAVQSRLVKMGLTEFEDH